MPAKTKTIDAQAWTHSNGELARQNSIDEMIGEIDVRYSGGKFAMVEWANFCSVPPENDRNDFALFLTDRRENRAPCVT